MSGGLLNINSLTLSTATGLRVGNGIFDAITTDISTASTLTGSIVQGPAGLVTNPTTLSGLSLTKNGDISYSGGVLTVDRTLLIDSQAGNIQANNSFTTVSGGTLTIASNSGGISNLNGSLFMAGGNSNIYGNLNVATIVLGQSNNGALNLFGPSSIGDLVLDGGLLHLYAPTSIVNFAMSGGGLNGNGSLTVDQFFSRTGGSIGSNFTRVSITQAGGDLAPGALNVAGPLSLTTLDPNSTLLINDNVISTGMTIQAAGSLVVGNSAQTTLAALQSIGDQTISAKNILLQGGSNGINTSLISANGTQTISANSITIDGVNTQGFNTAKINGGGDVSLIATNGDLNINGAIIGNTVNLWASGKLLLQPNAQLSTQYATSGSGLINLLAGQELTMAAGAILNASPYFNQNGGTVLIDAPVITLNGLSNLPSINTSGASTGGTVSIGSRVQPTTVNLNNFYISADPPLTGGNISIFGGNITINNSTFNVTGSSGGSVAIGNSATSLITIQGANLIGGGSASFTLTGASIFATGLNVSGGLLTQPGSQSATSAITSSYLALASTLTQPPLNTEQSPALTGGATTLPLQTLFDPQLMPAVAISLQESNFLYSGDYATDPNASDGTNRTSSSRSRSSSTGSSGSSSPVRSPDASDSSTRPPSELSRTGTTTLQTGSPQPTQGQGGRGGLDSGKGLSGAVTPLSSAEATSRFNQDETRAQGETAKKLGLGTPSGQPPTPAQIQGVLQRVMTSVGNPGSVSSGNPNSSSR